MTASTPRRTPSSRTVGMPPPLLAAPVLPGLAVLDQPLRLALGEEPADRLRRPAQPGVVGGDEHAGHHRRAGLVDAAGGELVVERVHEGEAEGGLRLRSAP